MNSKVDVMASKVPVLDSKVDVLDSNEMMVAGDQNTFSFVVGILTLVVVFIYLMYRLFKW